MFGYIFKYLRYLIEQSIRKNVFIILAYQLSKYK